MPPWKYPKAIVFLTNTANQIIEMAIITRSIPGMNFVNPFPSSLLRLTRDTWLLLISEARNRPLNTKVIINIEWEGTYTMAAIHRNSDRKNDDAIKYLDTPSFSLFKALNPVYPKITINTIHSTNPSKPCVTVNVGTKPKPVENSVFQNTVGLTTIGLNLKYCTPNLFGPAPNNGDSLIVSDATSIVSCHGSTTSV